VSSKTFSEGSIRSEAGRNCSKGEAASEEWTGDVESLGYRLPQELVTEAYTELTRWSEDDIAVRGKVELLPVAKVHWGNEAAPRFAYVCGLDLKVRAPHTRQVRTWVRDVRAEIPSWAIATLAALIVVIAAVATYMFVAY
jgi:hypothetical protein